ncbi:hypothetical protein JT358_03090 [Micrococcales bacterium 31B]|nr:hypothetical protein [Micrococcales bacterium 31B]
MTTLDTTSPQAAAASDSAAALAFGVGARITAAVMCDDYADVILGALAQTPSRGLTRQTTDVSTYLGGSECDLYAYVTDFALALAATGRHATLSIHLSRGCPGELGCSVTTPRVAQAVEPRHAGHFVTADWSLYPLADAVTAGVEPDHMRDIYAAIDLARSNGTFVASEHFATRLVGDLGAVLHTVFSGWAMVGRSVQHVTTHATLSINSPSQATRSGSDAPVAGSAGSAPSVVGGVVA